VLITLLGLIYSELPSKFSTALLPACCVAFHPSKFWGKFPGEEMLSTNSLHSISTIASPPRILILYMFSFRVRPTSTWVILCNCSSSDSCRRLFQRGLHCYTKLKRTSPYPTSMMKVPRTRKVDVDRERSFNIPPHNHLSI